MRTRALIVVATAVTVFATGCTTPEIESTPTPPPIPTSTPTPIAGAPAVLPFDCDTVIDDVTWERIVGGARPEQHASDPYFVALERSRGYGSCSWYRSEPYANVRVSVFTRDSIVFEAPTSGEVGGLGPADSLIRCQPINTLGIDCTSHASVNGYVLSAYLGGVADEAGDGGVTASRDLFAPVVAALESSSAPPAWSVPEGAGPAIADCAAIESVGSLAAAVGDPTMTVADETGQGEDGSTPRDVTAAWGETLCVWRAADPTAAAVWKFDVHLLAGGGWMWREIVPMSEVAIERVSVTGADEAALACTTSESCTLLLRVGEDSARISGSREYSYAGRALDRAQLIALGTALVVGLG